MGDAPVSAIFCVSRRDEPPYLGKMMNTFCNQALQGFDQNPGRFFLFLVISPIDRFLIPVPSPLLLPPGTLHIMLTSSAMREALVPCTASADTAATCAAAFWPAFCSPSPWEGCRPPKLLPIRRPPCSARCLSDRFQWIWRRQ